MSYYYVTTSRHAIKIVGPFPSPNAAAAHSGEHLRNNPMWSASVKVVELTDANVLYRLAQANILEAPDPAQPQRTQAEIFAQKFPPLPTDGLSVRFPDGSVAEFWLTQDEDGTTEMGWQASADAPNSSFPTVNLKDS